MELLKAFGWIIFTGTISAFLYFYVWKMIYNKIILYRGARTLRKIAKRQPEGAERNLLMDLSKQLKQAAKEESLIDKDE
jgi:hypothetical protein